MRLLDVLGPFAMAVDRIGAEADQLDVALVEIGLELGGGAELGGADGGEVLGVGEEDAPAVAQPFVEADLAFGGFRLEVGRGVADAQSHENYSCSNFLKVIGM